MIASRRKDQFYSIANLQRLRLDYGRKQPENSAWTPEQMIQVVNQESGPSIVRLYDEIGFWGIEAQDVVDMLEGITGDSIELRINSPGGDVFDGIAILTTLMALNKPIDAHVDGIAASIASVILMAGDKITMPENTRIMIHDPFVFAIGNAGDLRKTADMLDMVKDDIVATYMRHAKIAETEVRDLMSDETFLGARDAVDKGFAHNFVPLRAPIEETNEGDTPQDNTEQELAYLLELEAV